MKPIAIVTPWFGEALKLSALVAAKLTIMPLVYESLNIVVLESGLRGTPVLVNGCCEVLKAQCRESNSGLWYDNQVEFEACLRYLLNDKDTTAKLA